MMESEDRVEISVSDFGSVIVELFYYRKWRFFIGADYADDAEDVMDRIEEKYLNSPQTHKHLRKGFERYRDELKAAVESEVNETPGGKRR